jgi:pimeloyl-ACP methyl ester carboxylesterase
MQAEIKSISVGELTLEYYVYGDGPTDVICLHGHGRNAKDFEFIASPEKRVISIHLFFHGNSKFPEQRIESEPLTSDEFLEIFGKLLKIEKVDRFHLLAFSQGGRFSLCLLPVLADQIITLTLIAPDGMDNNSFYNWSSRQKWARNLFRRWEKDPKHLTKISRIASRLGLMRPKVRSFVDEFAANEMSFKRASYTWRGFRNLLPNPKRIGETIREKNIPFLIIMGSFDQVIRPKQAYAFEKRCGLKGHVVEVENGHNFFKSSSINKFVHLLPFMD